MCAPSILVRLHFSTMNNILISRYINYIRPLQQHNLETKLKHQYAHNQKDLKEQEGKIKLTQPTTQNR